MYLASFRNVQTPGTYIYRYKGKCIEVRANV